MSALDDLRNHINRSDAAWDLSRAALIEQGQEVPDGTPVEEYSEKILAISGGDARIELTLQTVDDFNENGNEVIAIQAEGGMIQHVTTDENGFYLNKFTPTDTPYTFSVDTPPEVLRDEIFFNPTRTTRTGLLNQPATVKLEYVRKDLTNPQYMDLIRDVIEQNAGVEPEPVVSEIFGNFPGFPYCAGGVNHPNGKLYGVPRGASFVVEFDPETETFATFGNVGTAADKWFGGAVHSKTGNIYCAPYNATSVLKIYPKTRATSTFGSVGGGTLKWSGIIESSNGKMYCIPANATAVLEIDPETDTTSTFGSLGATTIKWVGGTSDLKGDIYCCPANASNVLIIKPATRTTATFGSLGAAVVKWVGIVYYPNGKFYCCPYNTNAVLEIDPELQLTSLFGDVGSGTDKWYGMTLHSDGNFYAAPLAENAILKVNPRDKTVFRIGDVGSDTWSGALSASNGNVYMFPFGSLAFLKISFDNLIGFGPSTTRSVYLNKF